MACAGGCLYCRETLGYRVSNFKKPDLDNILSACRVKPMVNQILLHISNTDEELLEYCRAQGILVEAYSPIAHGEALKNPVIADMAKKYDVSTAQLCIRYVLELGAVALPKTANPEHMKTNAEVDFTIAPAGMEILKHTVPIKDYGEFSFSRCSAESDPIKTVNLKGSPFL